MNPEDAEPARPPVDLPQLDLAPTTRRLLDIITADPRHTPCRGSGLWTGKQAERQEAATICRDQCRYLHLCAEAVEAEDPAGIAGVWAGVDYTYHARKKDQHA